MAPGNPEVDYTEHNSIEKVQGTSPYLIQTVLYHLHTESSASHSLCTAFSAHWFLVAIPYRHLLVPLRVSELWSLLSKNGAFWVALSDSDRWLLGTRLSHIILVLRPTLQVIFLEDKYSGDPVIGPGGMNGKPPSLSKDQSGSATSRERGKLMAWNILETWCCAYYRTVSTVACQRYLRAM